MSQLPQRAKQTITSVDQLAATLAKWMGVSDANVALVAPNIGNYTGKNLGLMKG
jgi:hypothetical protein